MADLTESEVAVATRCPPENVVRVWPAVLAELKGRTAGGRLSQIGAAATIMVETGPELKAKFLPVVENLNYGAEGLRKTWPKRFPSPTVALEYARKPEAIANYVYASRNGNGDEASGDGWRYRGRGLIQLTGRRNYRNAGLALGHDYEAEPDLVLDLTHAAPIFAWYWAEHGLPQVCETAQWDTARQIVNGGEIGLEAFKACIRRFGVAA